MTERRNLDGGVVVEVLEVLLEIVDACMFVLGRDGEIVLANARGRSMLASGGDVLHAFLHSGTAAPNDVCPDPSSWSAGSLRGWRRRFEGGSGERLVLAMIEQVETTADSLVDRAVRVWALTARQVEVFRLVLEGHSNKEIAESLAMASRTVEVHITNVLLKANVDSRARLIAKAWHLQDQSSRRSPLSGWLCRLDGITAFRQLAP